ncbi:MAG: helix-turn-helix transcriptional regulator [Sphingomonadaceae bacterium]|nr:helix-turn-helix transcriptional regulator [Sphingomonadaceae bacterium]
MSFQHHIGRNVAHLRRGRGWSQENLGFEAGVDRTYISQIERGVANPSVASLMKVAKALAVPCFRLLEPY